LNKEDFIPNQLNNIQYSENLEKEIKFANRRLKSNEANADKFLIAPILNKIWLHHPKLNLWAQQYIKYDTILQSRPDYLISPVDKEQFEVLTLPIVVLVEAKKDNFAEGWGQCLAEMVA